MFSGVLNPEMTTNFFSLTYSKKTPKSMARLVKKNLDFSSVLGESWVGSSFRSKGIDIIYNRFYVFVIRVNVQ